MATVCFARTVGAAGFSRTVAIKRLHPHLVDDPEFTAMFLDEARLAARVRHPSVVSTLDVVAEGGELLLVMEYVAGESLAALTRHNSSRPQALPPAIVVSIVSGVLHGLHAAHEARTENGAPLEIVHRDVSPHNILVGEDGVARLIDFGIARAAVRSHITRAGQLKGKLRYIAPEQLQGAPATRRADVYAAAVVLWDALTGERLFGGDNDGAIYGRILEGVVRPPSAFAGVPPALDAVILRALARDPGARYTTALEMAEELDLALPPAPPREVAAWLRRIAGPVLEERARRVREIEGGGADEEESRTDVPSPAAESTQTDNRQIPEDDAATRSFTRVPEGMPVSSSSRPPPKPSRARSGVLLAGTGLSLVLAIALAARATERPPVPPARSGLAAAVLLASRHASIAAEPVPFAPSAPNAEPAQAPGTRRPSASPAGVARSRSACDPPYYLDGTGIRRVKRECL
jgi:serine/threonine-protein kinase